MIELDGDGVSVEYVNISWNEDKDDQKNGPNVVFEEEARKRKNKMMFHRPL